MVLHYMAMHLIGHWSVGDAHVPRIKISGKHIVTLILGCTLGTYETAEAISNNITAQSVTIA